MSVHKIHLWKLLKLIMADESLLRSELRKDIRSHIEKEQGLADGGADFYLPFWSDAKRFVSGSADLNELTEGRISKNKKSRRKLYPKLAEGFLRWWNEERQWSNEKFEISGTRSHGKYEVKESGAVIKVENLLDIKIGDVSERKIYPYFSNKPPLSKDAARIGLWVISQTLSDCDPGDIRIIDIIRGKQFSIDDYPLNGNEEENMKFFYFNILKKWDVLRQEY